MAHSPKAPPQAMTDPPDRSHVATEHRHPLSTHLDELTTGDLINLFADDHAAVINAVRSAAPALASFIDQLSARMSDGGRLIYVGAGTSGRLGVLDASECPPTFQSDPDQVVGIIAGGDSALRKSSEGKEDDEHGAQAALDGLILTANDTLLGIAAGGTTPYVLGAIRIAKARGCVTGLLTCADLHLQMQHDPSFPHRRESSMESCDHLIHLPTGPELLTGSTRLKAGSATKLALNIISTGVFVRMGKCYGNLMVDVRATNAKLMDRAIRILMELCPELDRAAAMQRLDETEGKLKTAIVMQRLDVSREEAERMLAEKLGRLRDVLD